MNEMKEGAIGRIKAVLSVYKSKQLSFTDRMIVKEYETNLRVLVQGYVVHTFYKISKCLLAVIAGFLIALVLKQFIH